MKGEEAVCVCVCVGGGGGGAGGNEQRKTRQYWITPYRFLSVLEQGIESQCFLCQCCHYTCVYCGPQYTQI